MGDMKTPDFDDLLAAFDIPDATSLDAKEAIQSTSDETDGHLKPAGMCIEENLSVHHPVSVPDVPVVSVIVKNTSRQESVDATAEKDSGNLGSNILQNGFRGSDSDSRDTVHSFGKFESSFINGDNSKSYSEKVDLQKSENVSYSQFSPISSPEPEDATKGDGVEEKQKHEERPYFPHAVYAASENSVNDGIPAQPEHELSMFDQYSKKDQKSESGTKKENAVEDKVEQVKASGRLVEGKKDAARNSCPSQAVPSAEGSNPGEAKVGPLTDVKLCSSVPPRQRIKTARSKLSNCLAALVALQAKKVAEAAKEDLPYTASEPMPSLKEGGKGSPKMISKSPRSPRSPAEVVKKMKQPDSPRSVCSDSSGKASPSLAGGSPPAIPKVRIKTIKTASGEIKRTVTRIVTDSEQDEMDRSETSSVENVALEHCSPKLPSEPNPGDVVGNGKSMEPSKDAPGTPSHLSDETNSGLQEVGASLDGSVQKPDTVLLTVPSLSSNNTGGNVNVAQQSAGVQQAQSPGNAGLLPKAVHLANLNLVPHSVAASVTAKSVSVRQNQPQLTTQVVYSSVPLVHQVKKPAPVASGIVEAFNKLLNGANPVPIYSPNLNPPPESNISVPVRGYHCLECGDSFALQKSLKQHYARRSVHLEVTCTHCSKTLLFFNKCSLLAHAREHKSKGFVMQCSQLLMKPVSADQMFSSSSSTATYVTVAPQASSLGSVSLATVSKPVVTAQNNGTVTFPYSQPAMPLFTDPLRLTRHGQKCFECNTQVNDENVLAAHYQWVADENDGLTCQVCQMMLPNKCSYSAHQRIHAHKSPYCCPECGALCRSAYFQTHVKENCLHYARKVGFRCVHCGSVFLTLGLLKVHIQEKHCEVFHKCAYCPMAFKSSESTATHISTQHSTLENKASQVLYKCSCEAIFNKQKLLHQHFYENSKLLVSVFKCPQCQLVYTQKPLLMQHVKSVHGVPQNPEDLSSLRQRSETSSGNQVSAVQSKTTSSTAPSSNSKKDKTNVPKSEAKPRPKNTGWTCAECSEWIPDRETYVSHMKNHGWLMKRYPCRQCTRSFSCPNTLRKHTRITHEKKSYSCCYCTDEKQSFTTRLMLESHISEKHSTNNPDSSQVPKPDLSKVDHSDLPPEKDPEQDLPPKRTAETVQMDENTEDDIESTPAKKLRAHYRCGKCGFLTESSSEFQDHIPEHKPEKSGLQCLHCGLCFTSQVSLNRHLFIIHKQKGPDGEEEEGKQKDEEQVLGTSKTSETGQEDQTAETNITNAEDNGLHCKVCHKAFDTETARNAHMRSHAVPFLRSK